MLQPLTCLLEQREVIRNSQSASSEETSMANTRVFTKKQRMEQNRKELLEAATKCNAGQLKQLVRNSSNVNARYRERGTLLMQCASKGNAECVNVLLDVGAIVNLRDTFDRTALMFAALSGNAECVEVLIKAGAKLNLYDQRGETALVKSVHPKESQCMRLLLQAGAKVNAVTDFGNSALMIAVTHRDVEKIQLLINAGAEVNAVNKDGHSSLIMALRNQNVKPKRFGLKQICDSKFDCVKHLLESGADVNQYIPSSKVMPLSFAILCGEVNCVKLLLQHGATVNRKYFEGLFVSLRISKELRMDEQCMELFYAAGASVNKSMRTMDQFMYNEDPMRLRHSCREQIRKEIVFHNPDSNVFVEVDKLPLPTVLKSYLHYNRSLEVKNIRSDNVIRGCSSWAEIPT